MLTIFIKEGNFFFPFLIGKEKMCIEKRNIPKYIRSIQRALTTPPKKEKSNKKQHPSTSP